jgi:hypothetical protein
MNNIKIDNFILEYENFLPTEYCDYVIEYYNNMENSGFGINNRSDHMIKDSSVFLHDSNIISLMGSTSICSQFINRFWEAAYKPYVDKYSIFSSIESHKIYYIKVQKTNISQGYHVWHGEDFKRDLTNRLLTFTLYLNDVDEGGETEFLYYSKRVKAKKGTLLLFPGNFCFTHRGNPPISNSKYIITGWVEI